MEILHVCLNVSDIEVSSAFYQSEFGLTPTWDFVTDDGKENRYFEGENGFELQLSEVDTADGAEDIQSWGHLAFKVNDLSRALERIDHYGIVEEPRYVAAADARVAFIADPDGHVIELIEPQ
ncbi:VOC family protein [Haloferax profundi]|uniref:Lactoylglutathione lyase n=1 Tax=Haloferax profundi TaxID=1544718 RepID=A0A0W1RF17_9EURY|nr:VOC family protein [Haloferax profundi]KTG12230.1 lactoylglutathione lyase [Haloferax profundi]